MLAGDSRQSSRIGVEPIQAAVVDHSAYQYAGPAEILVGWQPRTGEACQDLAWAPCDHLDLAPHRRWVEVPSGAGTPLAAHLLRKRQAAALAELAHITGGRTDLLARYAGLTLAFHDGTGPDASVRERAAQLCIIAGADMRLIDRWSRQRHARH